MPRTITHHAPADCGCTATSWYASSDCGMFDDGDTIVDACDWHALLEDAFLTYLDRRVDGQEYDETYWVQVVERERERTSEAHDYAWSQVRPAYDADVPF